MGVLFWELTSGGLLPFENKKESKESDYDLLMYKILEGKREEPIPNTNPKFIELYQSKYKLL